MVLSREHRFFLFFCFFLVVSQRDIQSQLQGRICGHRFSQSGQIPEPTIFQINCLLKRLSLRLLVSRLRFPNLARLPSPTIFLSNLLVESFILRLLASRLTFPESGQSPQSYRFPIQSLIPCAFCLSSELLILSLLFQALWALMLLGEKPLYLCLNPIH